MSDSAGVVAEPRSGSPRGWRGHARRVIGVGVVPAMLLVSGAVVWKSSYAAFTASTVNPANNWTAGKVALSDSQGGNSSGSVGTPLWTAAANLKPGDTGERCIQLTYHGSLAASVRLYIAPGGLTGTGLGTYLRMSIDISPTGSAADCSDFGGTPSNITNIYDSGDSSNSNTLANIASFHTNYATGLYTTGASNWAPTADGDTETYRIKYTLLDNNLAENLNATAAFTWEADNT